MLLRVRRCQPPSGRVRPSSYISKTKAVMGVPVQEGVRAIDLQSRVERLAGALEHPTGFGPMLQSLSKLLTDPEGEYKAFVEKRVSDGELQYLRDMFKDPKTFNAKEFSATIKEMRGTRWAAGMTTCRGLSDVGDQGV